MTVNIFIPDNRNCKAIIRSSLTFPGKLDKLILILTWRPEGSQEKENA